MANRGIFCLEGDWSNDFNRVSTVKPVLKLLSAGHHRPIPYVHRDVGTVEELEYYISRWAQRGMATHPILYLAFHGKPGVIQVGDQRRPESKVGLERLATVLGRRLNGRVVHFGSCETLKIDKRRVRTFLRETGAAFASGFTEPVDWLSSSAFEVLMFEVILRNSFTQAGARRSERQLRDEWGPMLRKHGFRFVTRDP